MTLTLYHFQGCPYCGRVRFAAGKEIITVVAFLVHAQHGAQRFAV